MKSLNVLFRSMLFLLTATFIFTSCEDDDTSTSEGNVRFEITDAPIDDADVESVFVTVTAIEVDGEPISNFEGKQTIDLLAYQNGKLKGLGSADLDAGAYSNVQLVLDYVADADGNAPGCYVLTKDGTKHDLQMDAGADTRLNVAGSFMVEETGKHDVVLDFDIRKAVTYSSNNVSDYSFVTDSELDAANRLVMKSNAGSIAGNVSGDMAQAGSQIVVYAYKKGTYTDNEMEPAGASDIRFKNAVTSAKVQASGTYKLAFLEEGEYELVFIGYEDADSDGQLELKGSLILDILGSLNLDDVSVKAQSEVSLDVEIKGILPF